MLVEMEEVKQPKKEPCVRCGLREGAEGGASPGELGGGEGAEGFGDGEGRGGVAGC